MASLLDRLARRFGYVKPGRRRNYQAGKIDRLKSSWTTTALTSDETLRRYLRVLRARSREQAENNDYAKRFVALVKNNVVGPDGIILQARTRRTDTGVADKPANEAIEQAWKNWGQIGICDMTHTLSWVMIKQLFIQSVAVDGEVLVRKVKGRAAGPRFFALQFIDPELLDVHYNERRANGNFVRMGIEFNQWAQPVAYHIIDQDISQDSYVYAGRRYLRIPADEIIHSFLPERIGQKRGVPWMSTGMMRMQMLSGYEEAALVNARAGAAKMGFFTSEDGNGYPGDDEDADGNIITEAEPGTMEQLPNGVKFEAYDPTYPRGEFGDFIKACLRGISSGLGVSYNTLANDLEGVNYSSIRAGVLEDREAWKSLQNWMVTAFCKPVYESWLSVQLSFGLIKIGNSSLIQALEEKYKRVIWQPRRWAWVDPLKDIKASAEAIDRRICSVSDVIREQGRDPDDVFHEIAEEQKRMSDLGILDEMPKFPDVKTVNEKRIINGDEEIDGADAIYMPASDIPAIEIEKEES